MMLSKPSLLLLTALSLFSTLATSQKCTGQSCAIAALSGSTNESYEEITKASGSSKTPSGSNSKGKECITKYYKELGLKAPGGNLAKGAGGDATRYTEFDSRKARRSVQEKVVKELEESGNWEMIQLGIEKRQAACKPNALLFARGTTEPGTMGTTVGPALSRALGSKWRSEGVKYTADIAGDDCIGFPGGIKCRDQLEVLAKACPETKWFLAGYSQGAMVARICTAFSKPEIKEKIKGVVVFGDPFNGASIKGFPQDGIKTFCAASDGVCQGQFKITAGHLGYTMGSSISDAAKWMNARAGS